MIQKRPQERPQPPTSSTLTNIGPHKSNSLSVLVGLELDVTFIPEPVCILPLRIRFLISITHVKKKLRFSRERAAYLLALLCDSNGVGVLKQLLLS